MEEMNYEELKRSGLLEQYALGLTSQEESDLVEAGLIKYPDLLEQVGEIQDAMNTVLKKHNIETPKHANKNVRNPKHLKGPLPYISPLSAWIALAVASVLICLLALSTWIYYKSSENSNFRVADLKKEIQSLQTKNEALSVALNRAEDKIDHISPRYGCLKHMATEKILLKNPDQNIDKKVAVYWNADQSRAFLHYEELPPLPKDTTYRLWAKNSAGVMIDLGIIPVQKDSLLEIQFVEDVMQLNLVCESLAEEEPAKKKKIVLSGTIGY